MASNPPPPTWKALKFLPASTGEALVDPLRRYAVDGTALEADGWAHKMGEFVGATPDARDAPADGADGALGFRREQCGLYSGDAPGMCGTGGIWMECGWRRSSFFTLRFSFSAIDDLEVAFRKEQAKGISRIREARMLCKKIVNFFSLLSHTQELLSLVTGLAHYLKILIRIALSGALRPDRDFDKHGAINWFLSQLAFLAREGTLSGDVKALSGSSASGGAASNGTLDTVNEATPGAGGCGQ
ncbi:hypothetical protein V8E36_008485 [Tilletia maclaganii]